MKAPKPADAYTKAGVSIDAGRTAVDLMKAAVRSTWGPGVLDEYGSFAGLCDMSRARGDVLAVTIDGVGTKLKVAAACGKYDTVGMDLVNHCTDDLLAQRARPLLFADYFASSSLDPQVVAEAVGGMAEACRAVGCSLVAGETAEMPGVYCDREFDLVGCMIGTASKECLDGIQPITEGDVLIGLESSGLHTNGFSLARHILFEKAGMSVDTHVPDLGREVREELLSVHREYLTALDGHLDDPRVRGLAHITGGGFYDNIGRILPDGLQATIELSSWEPPAVFRLLKDLGELDDAEAYRVFNMGIGMVIVVESGSESGLLSALSTEARVIGRITAGTPPVALI